MRHPARLAAPLLACLLLAACASAPGAANKPPLQVAVESIADARDLYMIARSSAALAHQTHALSDAQYDAVVTQGERLRVAINAASTALAAYLSLTGATDDTAALATALDALEQAKAALSAWRQP